MADLDVAFLIDDPDFNTTVTVRRLIEAVNNFGRLEYQPQTFNDVIAVVIPMDTGIGGNNLELGPDGQVRNSNIIVYSRFRLRSASQDSQGQGWQADQVIWNGDPYRCNLINDYTLYGEGFVKAECGSIDMLDNPPGEFEAAAEPEAPAEAT